MSEFDRLRGAVTPGDGVVGRWPGVVVLVPPARDAIASFDALMAATADPPRPSEIRTAVSELLATRPDAHVAAVVETDEGGWAMAAGATLIDTGREIVQGSTGTVHEMSIVLGDEPIVIRGAAFAVLDAEASFDLRAGVVPGAAVHLIRASAAPAADVPPAPPADVVAGQPLAVAAPGVSFDLVDLDASVAARSPLPVVGSPETPSGDIETTDGPTAVEVHGVLCSRDHFNNPLAAYCMVCGISMIHRTAVQVPGVRPTLGFIVFDDGSTYALDRGYLIGREPSPRPDLEALIADDIDGTVSREHAELRLDGWDVVIADLGSTNGSFVWDREQGQWRHVATDTPVTLQPGAIVAVGRRTFTFESVHRTAR